MSTSTVKDLTSTLKDLTSTVKDLTSTVKDLTSTMKDVASTPKDVASTVDDLTAHREASGWETLVPEYGKDVLRERIRDILRSASTPWRDIKCVPEPPAQENVRNGLVSESTVQPTVQQSVMNVLQEELDGTDSKEKYFTLCFQCLRELSKARDIYPESLMISKAIDIAQDRRSPVLTPTDGGSSADVYQGKMDGKKVCIKAFRIFGMEGRESQEFLKVMHRETIVWKQLRHENILPFIGVDTLTLQGRPCLISPWMDNGAVIRYLKNHPDTDCLKFIREIATAIDFIHGIDPKVIHGDIRGNNIIVDDKGHCCLADFGASIIVATNVPSQTTMSQNSSRWLCPELQEYNMETYVQELLPGRDIYAFGCTIIEIYTLDVPFPEVHRNAIASAITKGITHRRPKEISSDGLWKLVEQCMAYDPAQRPNAAQVKDVITEMCLL